MAATPPASTIAARAAGAVRQQNEQHIPGRIARRRVQRLAKALYKTAFASPGYFQGYSRFGTLPTSNLFRPALSRPLTLAYSC